MDKYIVALEYHTTVKMNNVQYIGQHGKKCENISLKDGRASIPAIHFYLHKIRNQTACNIFLWGYQTGGSTEAEKEEHDKFQNGHFLWVDGEGCEWGKKQKDLKGVVL